MRQVQKLASKNRRMSAASIVLEIAEEDGQLVSDHMPHTATSQFAWPSSQKEASSEAGLKKKPEDNLAKSMTYWNHVLWSEESKVNLFGSDGVQHVWRCLGEEYQESCALPTVKHGGGSIMVLGCMTTMETGTVLDYYT